MTRVLIVDDDPLVRKAVARVLARRCELTMVGRGDDAIALLSSGARYDCIFCDLLMPDMTGFELYAVLMMRFRELADRVIFFSGAGEVSKEFLRRIPNDFLEKPFNVSTMREMVERGAR
jgi:CheY-like chemotaxis protein